MTNTETETKYRVTVNCCTSGNCVLCMGKAKFGTPIRRLHTDGVSKEHAELIAKNFHEYKPIVSEMK